MALPLWLSLNCLTHVLVWASLWRMDGCQHSNSTTQSHFMHFCSVWMCSVLLFPFTLLLSLPLSLYSSHRLCVCFVFWFVFFFSSFQCLSISTRVAFFLPPRLQSIVCQSNMWQVVRRSSKCLWGVCVSILTKAPSPELACSWGKKIHQLPPWLNDVSTTPILLPLLRWMAQLGSAQIFMSTVCCLLVCLGFF